MISPNAHALSFRPVPSTALIGRPAELVEIGELIDDALQPGHFYVASALQLAWDGPRREQVPWEVFRGQLVDAAQTRDRRTFLSWHITPVGSADALLSVQLDVETRQIHVTRGILCERWEAYDAGAGVIDSRQAQRWTQELVGTIAVDRLAGLDELHDELICMVWQAVVGTSRLPLTSIEAPLPAFVLGQLAYVYRADLRAVATPLGSWQALLEHGLQQDLCRREQVKLLEVILRTAAAADVAAVAERFVARWRELGRMTQELPSLLRNLFNEVSLSPYTQFVDNTLAWLDALVSLQAIDTDAHIDFLSHLLRQLGRHLSAYDLVTFHHRGANYPDALLLDAVLKRYLRLIETNPERFAGPAARLRRRALRHACLLRRQYEGHLVPDAPTSPGENARVFPGLPNVAEEQLLQVFRRRRQLFAGDPLAPLLGTHARTVLQQAIADLDQPEDAAELGLGVFIDRPLGYAKPPGEPDQTPLLAHEAYSYQLAQRRLPTLESLARELGAVLPAAAGQKPAITGLSHTLLAEPARPIACLADVRRVADDFIIVRTLPGGVRLLTQLFDVRLPELPRLVVQVAGADGPVCICFDDALNPVRQFVSDLSNGHDHRAGVEFPSAGLRLVHE
jgi:hypothetical protein